MPAPAPAVQQIEYAPPPPWRKRKAFRRVVRGVVLLGVLAVAVYFAPAVWHRVMLLHAQRRCLSYKADPQKVVFESDRKRAATLLGSDPQYVALRPEGHPVGWSSADWDRLYTLLSPPGRKQAATVFMGERRAPAGHKRLVVIEVSPVIEFSGAHKYLHHFHAAVIEPGTLLSPPRHVGMGTRGISGLFLFRPSFEELRLLAAQADSEDECHFKIPYELNGITGTIDGWLRTDDSVLLEVRDGPAKDHSDLPHYPTPSAPSLPE